jgi:hypothetical protein
MRMLLKRWYVWLALLLLLGLSTSAALIYYSRGRISQANFDRIQKGMSEEEVIAILGEPTYDDRPVVILGNAEADSARWGEGCPMWGWGHYWRDGPDRITVGFENGKVRAGELHLATAWETLRWYAKKGAEEIGVK